MPAVSDYPATTAAWLPSRVTGAFFCQPHAAAATRLPIASAPAVAVAVSWVSASTSHGHVGVCGEAEQRSFNQLLCPGPDRQVHAKGRGGGVEEHRRRKLLGECLCCVASMTLRGVRREEVGCESVPLCACMYAAAAAHLSMTGCARSCSWPGVLAV
eukprot:361917-Chlamydomonas_euryale.AAC.7